MSFQSDIANAIIDLANEHGVKFVGTGYFDNNEQLSKNAVYSLIMTALTPLVPGSSDLENMDLLECSNVLVEHWKAKAITRGSENTKLTQWATETLQERDVAIGSLKEHISRLESNFNELRGNTEGYVYLMKRKNGDIKIGVSKDPLRRLGQIKNDHPSSELLYQMPADEPYKAEKLLHDEFQEKRKDGEWFALSDSDIESVLVRGSFQKGDFYVAMKGVKVIISADAPIANGVSGKRDRATT